MAAARSAPRASQPSDELAVRRAVNGLRDAIELGQKVRRGLATPDEIVRRMRCGACDHTPRRDGMSGDDLLAHCLDQALEHLRDSRRCVNVLGRRDFGDAWIEEDEA